MAAQQLAEGMGKAADLFAQQHATAKTHLDVALEALTRNHKVKTGKNMFLAYLEAYGLAKFEEDFIQRYISLVMVTRRYSHDEFIRWVDVQASKGRPLLAPAIPPRESAPFNDAQLAALREDWLE